MAKPVHSINMVKACKPPVTLLVKLGSYVFYLVCLIGCSYQLESISSIYFLYETVTELGLTIPQTLEAPDLSICIRYADIFNTSDYNRDYNASLSTIGAIGNVAIRELQAAVTLADIFNYTPAVTDLFDKCRIRLPGEYSYKTSYFEECDELFEVVNFYVQEYICYRFSFITAVNQTYQFRNLAYALAYPGMIYAIEFDLDTFQRADNMKAIIHSTTEYPYRSMAFAPSFFRKYNEKTGKAKYNLFQLTYNKIENTRLPEPYKTKCRDYKAEGLRSKDYCVKICLLNATQQEFGKLPFSTILIDPIHVKHINENDLLNGTAGQRLSAIEGVCNGQCSQDDCFEDYALTKVTKQPQENLMTFSVTAPQEPFYKIAFTPKMQLAEFLIYVLSCFGTWFGLSIVHLNPFKASYFRKKAKTGNGHKMTRKETRSTNARISQLRYTSPTRPRSSISNQMFCTFCLATRTVLRTEMRQELDYLIGLFVQNGGHDGKRRQANSRRAKENYL